MKVSRVSIIKDNIVVGTKIPAITNDAQVGQWADGVLESKGHSIDKNGLIDMPDYGIDNKTRKKGSNAHHTVGSMTIRNIAGTKNWTETRYYAKSQNQNQITYDADFLEVSKVKIIDMAIDLIQENLKDGYEDCRNQLVSGCRNKEIKSSNGWVVLDGYGHSNSYRMRITNKAMKKIHNISGSRDTMKTLFEEVA
jgi:hypothetical protein